VRWSSLDSASRSGRNPVPLYHSTIASALRITWTYSVAQMSTLWRWEQANCSKGAFLISLSTRMATDASSNGALNIGGAGTTVNLRSLNIGENGNAEVTIYDGASFNTQWGTRIGQFAGSKGVLRVVGSGTQFNPGIDPFFIGLDGEGQFYVESGAKVTATSVSAGASVTRKASITVLEQTPNLPAIILAAIIRRSTYLMAA